MPSFYPICLQGLFAFLLPFLSRYRLCASRVFMFFHEDLEAVLDFLVLSAPVLRQIARYLPHHKSENASKTHPKSSYDKFKTAS